MTNKEKADAISAKYGVSKLLPTEDECIAYSSAMEMAEWKDQKFQKVLEYAEICYGVFTFEQRDKFINHIKDIYYGN